MVSSAAKEKGLSGQQQRELASRLPSFISGQRWFRAKTRTIKHAEILDAIPLPETHCWCLIARLEYSGTGEDQYVLYLELSAVSSSGDIVEALENENFRRVLLRVMAKSETLNGTNGDLISATTSAMTSLATEDFSLSSKVSRAEQSNTSIIYGDRYILKLFRKIEAGINPDVEMGKFLTERGFKHTPAVLASLEYRRSNGDAYTSGILQELASNQGDAWKYTLDSLGAFFSAALVVGPPPQRSHPNTEEYRDLLSSYPESAYLLGRRTAEMHVALASDSSTPDFAPERFGPHDARALFEEISSQADTTFELLQSRHNTLSGSAANEASRALELESRIRDRIAFVRDQPADAVRIRFHGDYHLGQVLWTGSDFMIIDFEGEPARPLNERRAKGLALRDVAGMLRSFQYAAYAALFGQVPGIPTTPELLERVEQWAAFWNQRVQAEYLRGYFSVAENQPFLPTDDRERRAVLDAFLIQKALYEVAYELNNRPDWVRIPLRGILNLVG